MSLGNIKRPGRGRLFGRASVLAFAAGLALVTPLALAAGSGQDLTARVGTLEGQSAVLGAALGDLKDGLGVPVGASPNSAAGVLQPNIIVAQSNRELGALNVRVGQLEEQIRTLTGQVEGLQFQMTQLQTLLERMQEDSDARLAALEGGTPRGKTDAAPLSGGVTLPGAEPQALDLEVPDSGAPMDQLGSPIDLEPEPFTLGSPETPLGTLTLNDLATGLDRPLDLNHNAGAVVREGDADAQYTAGYDAVVRGDYAFAEDQFRQFVGLFPEHPQAPDAINWLGEALIQRGEYDDAADILLKGFQTYPNAARAPDILLKLGIALAGAGEAETACRTFAEVLRRYPNQPAAFNGRVQQEVLKSQC